jgi:hypothetical protein
MLIIVGLVYGDDFGVGARPSVPRVQVTENVFHALCQAELPAARKIPAITFKRRARPELGKHAAIQPDSSGPVGGAIATVHMR